MAAFNQPEGHTLADGGLGLQWIFAVLVLRFETGERALAADGDAVNGMDSECAFALTW